MALLGENATPEKIAQLRQQLGLDQPIFLQYFDWMKNAVQGDLGRSLFTGQFVHEAVFGRLAVTFQLVVCCDDYFHFRWNVLCDYIGILSK